MKIPGATSERSLLQNTARKENSDNEESTIFVNSGLDS
jgi:hypothetical protein